MKNAVKTISKGVKRHSEAELLHQRDLFELKSRQAQAICARKEETKPVVEALKAGDDWKCLENAWKCMEDDEKSVFLSEFSEFWTQSWVDWASAHFSQKKEELLEAEEKAGRAMSCLFWRGEARGLGVRGKESLLGRGAFKII